MELQDLYDKLKCKYDKLKLKKKKLWDKLSTAEVLFMLFRSKRVRTLYCCGHVRNLDSVTDVTNIYVRNVVMTSTQR